MLRMNFHEFTHRAEDFLPNLLTPFPTCYSSPVENQQPPRNEAAVFYDAINKRITRQQGPFLLVILP